VQVVDTTAAGDTFNAGFAAGLCMGKTLEESVRLGNAAGALAVTKAGAQAGMPTMEQAIGLQNSR
jgi:ribokinase